MNKILTILATIFNRFFCIITYVSLLMFLSNSEAIKRIIDTIANKRLISYNPIGIFTLTPFHTFHYTNIPFLVIKIIRCMTESARSRNLIVSLNSSQNVLAHASDLVCLV